MFDLFNLYLDYLEKKTVDLRLFSTNKKTFLKFSAGALEKISFKVFLVYAPRRRRPSAIYSSIRSIGS